MPVRVSAGALSHDRRAKPRGKTPVEIPLKGRRRVRIGLVNNMPESAFKATERQFATLLDAASDGIAVEMCLYSLPGVPRAAGAGPHPGYASVETLWKTRLDGLIVTGTEPVSVSLREEPYWAGFGRLVDWARENTYAAAWSCLAAHAAVLHLDDIGRRKSEEKHFGLFSCTNVGGHAMTAGAPKRFKVPHSRWNGLSAKELEASGYTVLTRCAGAQVDTFVKEDKSLFVFFQGHPEYESDTLLREYRRDALRYLRDEAKKYPRVPRGYFDAKTEAALERLRKKAVASRSKDLGTKVTAALKDLHLKNTWRGNAALMYRNWLEYICEQKEGEPRGGARVRAKAV